MVTVEWVAGRSVIILLTWAAGVPAASKLNTLLEAACKGVIAEEVLLCRPHAA